MLFKTKAKAQPEALPTQTPTQTQTQLTLSLEPTLSEKMYHILNQGPLGLVCLDDMDEDGDRRSIDMMSILEEGPGRRSEEGRLEDERLEAVSTPPFQTPRSSLWSEWDDMGSTGGATDDTTGAADDTTDVTDATYSTTPTTSTDELSSLASSGTPCITPATSNSSNGSTGALQPIGEEGEGEKRSEMALGDDKGDETTQCDSGDTSMSTIDADAESTQPSITLTSSQGSDSSTSSTPPLSPTNKSLSSPNLLNHPLRQETRSVSSSGLLESPLPQPRPSALASVLYVSQNPNAKSRSPATSRSASPHRPGHRRDPSSDGSEVPSTTNSMSFKSLSLKSDSSDSDSHSIRSMRSFRSSFRSFSHDSLFALKKRDGSLASASPLTPIFSNASTSSPSHDIKALESALAKFIAKQGTPKANILRIELLTLLRKETPVGSMPSDAVNIFAKWWRATLDALHARPSSHDKIAYMEAISKLLDRPEWKEHNSSVFSALVHQTVRYCSEKLSLKSVPVPLAAFSGKTFAYAFFHCPGVAHQLLAHLQVPAADLERTGPICDSPVLRPPVDGKPQIPLGPWIRRWASSVSDTFYSFLKHYYCISGGVEADGELPPGWIHVHAFILGSLDAVVRPRKPPAPPSLTPCIPKPRKIHKLKLLGALKELKKACHKEYYAHVLAPAIEDILKSVSLKTVVYDVEQCTALADLAEELLTVLESPLRSLDAPFWLNVVGIMLRSESHYTTLRALAFLHNTFPHNDPAAYTMYVDFILETDTLKKYFCHWHPLIRAAYMRVVCYRVLPKAPQKMNHCLVTVYTRLITYMEYCRVKESPLPVTDACSRLRIMSRDFEASNVDLVVQNLQNLDFVDIGVRGRGLDSSGRWLDLPERRMEPGTPPRAGSTPPRAGSGSTPSSGSSTPRGAHTPSGALTPSPLASRSSPRYFEDSPPRVSAFDVEDDLFEGVEKTTVKKWGVIRKEVYAHDEHAEVSHPVSAVSPHGISSQYKFVMESTSRSKTPPGSENFANNDEPPVAYPRLPFDLKDKTEDSQSTLDTVATSNTSVDDDAFRVPLDLEEFKDLTEYVKYWKYAGRSLNEWDGVVREYETFMTQFGGGGVPHMVGDMGRCAPL